MDAPDTTSANDANEPSSYIRTFAKDFARLSGKAPEPISVNSSQKKSLFPKKQSTKATTATKLDESLITNSDDQHEPVDLSVLEHQAEQVDKTTSIEEIIPEEHIDEEIPEPISLPRIDPGDIVRQAPKPAPKEPAHVYVAPKPQIPKPPILQATKEIPEIHHELKTTPITPLPKPAPTPTPIPSPQVPATPTPVDPEREAILARLKARVASHTSKPAEVVVPSPPAFTPPPISPTIPQVPPKPTPITEVAPVAAAPIPPPKVFEPDPAPQQMPAPPVPTPLSIPATHEESSEALHTYKSDFADHLEEKGGSAFSVLAAEKDAPRTKPVRRRNTLGSRIAVMLGALVFILAGAGAIYEAYVFMSKSAPIPLLSAPATLIIPDSSVALSGTGQSLLGALAQEAAQPIALNHVVNTYVTVSTTTSQGEVEEPGSGGALISELNLAAPDILLRNIDPSSMVGVVNAGGETRPFFILRVTSYERTFSGMLTWEPTMYADLAELYPTYPAPAAQTLTLSTSTPAATGIGNSSTTQATSTQIFIPPSSTNQTQSSSQFIDEVVSNHAARALTDLAGRTLLIYGYADKQTLIIARNEAAFTLLLSRLQANASN